MDYLAATFALIGVWMLTNKNRWGFLVCLCSGITWLCVSFQTGMYGLLLEVIPLMFVNVRGFVKWKK